MFRRKFEGSLWIFASGLKSTIPEAEIRALILAFQSARAGVRASILYGAPYDLAAAVGVYPLHLERGRLALARCEDVSGTSASGIQWWRALTEASQLLAWYVVVCSADRFKVPSQFHHTGTLNLSRNM